MTLERCPVLEWAASGGMTLTGFPGGATSLAPAGAFALLGSVADQLAGATRAVGREVRADPAELLESRGEGHGG